MTPFVKNQAPIFPETPITRTPEQERSLAMTIKFMREFSSKIISFLELHNIPHISPENEFSLRDLTEIDDFFKKYPSQNISFESEISHIRFEINLETVGILKPHLILRIFGKFVDMFEKFPSAYALQGIIQCSERYNISEGDVLISHETLEKKRKILLDTHIQGQKDALKNGIYSDAETLQKKEDRLSHLEQERKKLGA